MAVGGIFGRSLITMRAGRVGRAVLVALWAGAAVVDASWVLARAPIGPRQSARWRICHAARARAAANEDGGGLDGLSDEWNVQSPSSAPGSEAEEILPQEEIFGEDGIPRTLAGALAAAGIDPSTMDDAEDVSDYYPILLKAKYGDEWESLVMREAEKMGLLDADADFELEINSGSEYGDDGEPIGKTVSLEGVDYTEEDLRALVDAERKRAGISKQRNKGEGGDEVADGEAEEAAIEPAAEDDSMEAEGAAVEEEEEEGEGAWAEPRVAVGAASARTSASLGEFLGARAAGEVEIPSAYPASEWRAVFVGGLSRKRFEQMEGTYANLRVLLHSNFDDLNFDGEVDIGALGVADRALLKAKTLHAATRMPALAQSLSISVLGSSSARPPQPPTPPMYVEGLDHDAYDEKVSATIAQYKMTSSDERPVEYLASAAFVTHNLTLEAHGKVHMPLLFASAEHQAIALSLAHDDLFSKISSELNLPFVGTSDFEEFYELQQLKKQGKLLRKTGGSRLLRQKLIQEATLLDADIIKVSSFLNHMVDVGLMEACGEELAERFEPMQPSKVLTVEATGLLPAMFIGKALSLPVVYARKSRQVGVSDSYQTSYTSASVGKQTDLYVSTEYIGEGDRVLVIDDFLAGGRTADALIRLCRMAKAKVVGGGFLIEKLNDAGRAFLSGYEIPLESLALVSTGGGMIHVHDDPRSDEVDDGPIGAIGAARDESDEIIEM